MIDPSEMTARHAATLARLAEAGERLALKHAERALSADDPEVEARATTAFHRAARSVRQCLALEAKLVRDAGRAEREDRNLASREADARRSRRRIHVRTAVSRLIWTEAESEQEAERLDCELDDLLELERFCEDVTLEDVDAHIARLCDELGVTPAAPIVAPASPVAAAMAGRRRSAEAPMAEGASHPLRVRDGPS